MIRWIESFEQHAGARLSALLRHRSASLPRLGYTACPAHLGWANTGGPDHAAAIRMAAHASAYGRGARTARFPAVRAL